jgi:predicted esterase
MPPTFRSLVVSRHARIGIVGDLATASEAWLILHGYGMLAQGILHWFRHAERPGRVLVAPEGLSRFYQERKGVRTVGASWMTREDREHEIEDQQGYLDLVSADLLAAIPRVEVHGFSQGVAAAARWTARRTRPVARLVCWGGTLPDELDPALLGAAVAPEPIHFAVGDRDAWVAPHLVESDVEKVRTAGVPVILHRFSGGHRIDNGVLDLLEEDLPGSEAAGNAS